MILHQLPKGKENKTNNVENCSFVIATIHLEMSESVLRHLATTVQFVRNTKSFGA